jgi:cell division protein FtsQ
MAVLALLLLFGAGMVVYHLSSGFRLFALQQIDVRGTELLSQEEVESTVRDLLQEGVLRADLAQIRNTLRRQELVEDVEVTRLLPDTIRLVVRERKPVALARRADGSIVCVDQHGVLFGRASLYKDRPLPPLITGLREPGWETADPSPASVSAEPLGADAPLTPLREASLPSTPSAPSTVGVDNEAADFNRRSVETYLRLLKQIDQGFPALSTRLDEVQFDEFDDVRVTLSDSKTIVYLGREDYRQRLNAALDVLDAVARRDLETLRLLRLGDAERLLAGARIAYLNTKVPRRIVVGLSN